jgi:hypothetical protein
MFKNIIVLLAVVFLFTGCTQRQIMLSKLEKSDWYKTQDKRAQAINDGVIEPGFAYVIAGQIRKVSYNYPKKNIEGISLSDPYCMSAPFFWDRWFSSLPEYFHTSNDDYPSGEFPAVGEYWVFGISENFRGMWSVSSAAKLVYDKETEELKVIDSGASPPGDI